MSSTANVRSYFFYNKKNPSQFIEVKGLGDNKGSMVISEVKSSPEFKELVKSNTSQFASKFFVKPSDFFVESEVIATIPVQGTEVENTFVLELHVEGLKTILFQQNQKPIV